MYSSEEEESTNSNITRLSTWCPLETKIHPSDYERTTAKDTIAGTTVAALIIEDTSNTATRRDNTSKEDMKDLFLLMGAINIVNVEDIKITSLRTNILTLDTNDRD